jgi:hypothetical protein
MICAIIGAGQLGSRHLQGLLTYRKESLSVFIVDPSSESLSVSQQRADEIKHKYTLTFIQSYQDLPM